MFLRLNAGLGAISVTFLAAWEALGGRQFKSGKHQFIVGKALSSVGHWGALFWET